MFILNAGIYGAPGSGSQFGYQTVPLLFRETWGEYHTGNLGTVAVPPWMVGGGGSSAFATITQGVNKVSVQSGSGASIELVRNFVYSFAKRRSITLNAITLPGINLSSGDQIGVVFGLDDDGSATKGIRCSIQCTENNGQALKWILQDANAGIRASGFVANPAPLFGNPFNATLAVTAGSVATITIAGVVVGGAAVTPSGNNQLIVGSLYGAETASYPGSFGALELRGFSS